MSTRAKLRPVSDLAEMYAAALEAYVRRNDEACLHRAYQLGRQAVRDGKDILEMMEVHHRALLRAVESAATKEEGVHALTAGKVFFLEAMASYEMTNRAFTEVPYYIRASNAALHRLRTTREDEANRIAQILHDEAGQLLAVVHIRLEDIGRDLPGPIRERLQEVRGHLDRIEEQLRGLAHELRPAALVDQGLVPALRALAESVGRRTQLQISVQAEQEVSFPGEIEAVLYRVVQEALRNVSKHAQAGSVEVRVGAEDGSAICTVKDDGRGFEPGADGQGNGLGLRGMSERVRAAGGTYEIHSQPGQGTRLQVNIPLGS